jgi:3-hydroxyisobutyrate dehydrogenase-like beta-hydroxyacid dehydrogenase
MARVAVIGLGGMGSRIARRLLDAGHDVTVWNRDAAKAEPLAAAGASTSHTPAEAAKRAEAVVTMVADPEALAAVTEGPDGAAAGLSPGSVLIQMSTVGPPSLERLAGTVPEGSLLDAPVLGSIGEVEAGTLRIFAGGPAEFVERWTPLLETLGIVLHVGPIGTGTAAKLVANSTLVGVAGLLGEALALGTALGLPTDAAFEVLEVTPLGEQAKRRRPAFESGEYTRRFPLSLARKDADLILEAVEANGVDLRVVAAAREWLREAEAAGLGDRDYSAVLARILERTEGSQAASSSR